MGKLGFDNDKYLSMQSEHIRERISLFGGKLYLEFGPTARSVCSSSCATMWRS